jgi:hypothetical protein
MTVHDSARAMKFALVVCDATSAVVLLFWLTTSGRNPWWVLAYAWNPLVSLEGARNGHVDLLGTLCLVITALSLARGRLTIAGSCSHSGSRSNSCRQFYCRSSGAVSVFVTPLWQLLYSPPCIFLF